MSAISILQSFVESASIENNFCIFLSRSVIVIVSRLPPGPGDHCHHCDQNLAIKMKWPSCGHRLLAATAGWKIANINIDIDKSPVSAASADPDCVQGSIFSGQSGPFSARSRGTILEERAVTFQVSNTSLQIIIMSKHPAEFQSPNKSCRGFCSE